MQLSVIGKCPLFEKTQILPSVDAQYTFWLKSLGMKQKHTAPEKSNNLAAKSFQNQFVTKQATSVALVKRSISIKKVIS